MIPLSEEEVFRARVRRDPRLHAIVSLLERELTECRLTYDDLARCAVLAAQIHAERHCAPVMIRIEEVPEWMKRQPP